MRADITIKNANIQCSQMVIVIAAQFFLSAQPTLVPDDFQKPDNLPGIFFLVLGVGFDALEQIGLLTVLFFHPGDGKHHVMNRPVESPGWDGCGLPIGFPMAFTSKHHPDANG
jgi:hypothetical protein